MNALERERPKTKFLLYHDLANLAHGDRGLARARFRHQLGLVAKWGFRFRSIPQFLAGEASSPTDVVITFDDGGRSFLDCALPVLEEFGAPATMFVVAGFVGCAGRAMEFLTWDDIDRIAAAGVDIGSHGLGHLPLTGTDSGAIAREVAGATEIFRRRGHVPRTFCYPYGRFSAAAKDVVSRSGFEAAFTIKQGGHDRFELRRRLLTLAEPDAVLRFYVSDRYFGVRAAVVSLVPAGWRREWRPLPESVIGPRAFGLDGWEAPDVEPAAEWASEAAS